jgi:hypothetical protein
LSALSVIEVLVGHNHKRRDLLIDESRKSRVDFSQATLLAIADEVIE